jgi:hypothetical protein
MPTAFDPVCRQELVTRFLALTPDTPARWGRFTALKMASHVTDAVRMATGDLDVRAKAPGILKTAFVRWLVIHVLPFPKGAPTAPALLERGNTTPLQLDAERATFSALLDKVAARQGTGAWPDHPAFGRMTERDWGVLVYRHVDHHFRQFGI